MAIPRFALPLRYVNGDAITNDQGSLGDIASRVYAACAIEPGMFDDAPTIGLRDLTFTEEPLSSSQIAQMLSHSVPDAEILVEADPSKFDASLVQVGIAVKVNQ